jgi:hypothetical protein
MTNLATKLGQRILTLRNGHRSKLSMLDDASDVRARAYVAVRENL